MNLRAPHSHRSRYPATLWPVLLLLAALPIAAGSLVPADENDSGEDPLVYPAARGDFVHEVAAQGQLESSGTTDVAVKAHSDKSPWFRIIDVVEEGTEVEPGDFLLRLDSSDLENDRSLQQIECENSRAEVAKAREALALALAAKREYFEGQFVLAKKQAEVEVFTANEKVGRSARYVDFSRKLQSQGFITAQQLEADRFALHKAQTDLDLAKTKLTVLDEITRAKQAETLDSAIVVAKAQLRTAEYRDQRRRSRLKRIEDAIANCEIRAPVAGKVVLAHLFHYGHAHMIAPGEQTMENRVVVRLPDPKRMQVVAKILEDNVALVQPGMAVKIALEAFPHMLLSGTVQKINAYPEEPDWFDPSIQYYKATIAIDTPFEELRPGMSADLRICSESRQHALQVPLQAILNVKGESYCVAFKMGRPVARQVELGPTNDDMVVIRSGLEESERVALRPASYRAAVGLGPAEDEKLAASPAATPPPDPFSALGK